MGRPNIAIMELRHHWNYFVNTVVLMAQTHNVFLIVTEIFAMRLRDEFQFDISQHPHLLLRHFEYDKIYRFLSDHRIDRLLVNTIAGLEQTYAFSHFKPPVPFIVTVHNFDQWLGARPLLSDTASPLNCEINTIFFDCCRRIIHSSQALATIDESVRDAVAPLLPAKKIVVLPQKVHRTHFEPYRTGVSQSGMLQICVPGSIDGYRRDYEPVMSAASEICRRYAHVRFVILGTHADAYGEQVIEQARRINSEFNEDRVVFFNGYISQTTYEKWLASSDYFILPLRDSISYGKYKASGALYDALCVGRPVMIPKGLGFSPSFTSRFGGGIVIYENLPRTLDALLNLGADQLVRIHYKAQISADHFHIDRQVQYVGAELDGL